MKCLRCGPLIKAIDAYLAKAENDLYEQLTMEGYLKAKESLNTVDEIEEVVTKLLEDNADDLLKELADAIDLETFFKDNWPKFKNKSKLARDLFDVFHTQFSTIMPTYVEAYVQKTDAELTVTKLTKRTTDWISSWSSDLADIMKLDTETEIEAVLQKGLNDGEGINDVANLIADSGIRSPGYRARRVALTEVLRAHGYAQLESYIQSPAVEEKMWKHTGAYRNDPRQNHVDMDGVHVPKGQPFTLIGADGNTYYPMTPRDVCLPPRESVNCHCLLQPVVSEEVLGLSLEERQALQAQAIADGDDSWEKELDAKNRAKAGIDGPDAETLERNAERLKRYEEKTDLSPYELLEKAQGCIGELKETYTEQAEQKAVDYLSLSALNPKMSTYQLSNAYKELGQIYDQNDLKQKALDAYREGLRLNSGLSVKKRIKQLEKELNA